MYYNEALQPVLTRNMVRASVPDTVDSHYLEVEGTL